MIEELFSEHICAIIHFICAHKFSDTKFRPLPAVTMAYDLVLMAVLVFNHLCYMLGTRIVRQPNESAAAELHAKYCSAVLKIRLVSAQKLSLQFINMDIPACFYT